MYKYQFPVSRSTYSREYLHFNGVGYISVTQQGRCILYYYFIVVYACGVIFPYM